MRTVEEQAAATAVIRLMRGVVYRESDEDAWLALDRHGPAVRDHFAMIGVDVVVDDTEGFAYLRSSEAEEGEEPLPRLVRRRSLSHPVSLLLVLLRKRQVEFETSGAEGKLVLSRAQLHELLRLFLPATTDEARLDTLADTTVRKVAELGFLRQLPGQTDQWEVRRVLKAYVDAQTLGDYAGRLRQYADHHGGAADD